MGLLCGRAGRLTNLFGGFRPGQKQLFALFDVECKHSVAARICAVGFVLLGAGAQEVHFCADYVLDLIS